MYVVELSWTEGKQPYYRVEVFEERGQAVHVYEANKKRKDVEAHFWSLYGTKKRQPESGEK